MRYFRSCGITGPKGGPCVYTLGPPLVPVPFVFHGPQLKMQPPSKIECSQQDNGFCLAGPKSLGSLCSGWHGILQRLLEYWFYYAKPLVLYKASKNLQKTQKTNKTNKTMCFGGFNKLRPSFPNHADSWKYWFNLPKP